MPLKKPKSLPKISKARKKTASSIKEAVPQKKKDSIEFLCKVYFEFNPHKKKQLYIIYLETIKLFSVLNYELTIDTKKERNVIDVIIRGLQTKQTYGTAPRSASAKAAMEDLYGSYTINIIKQDGSINSAVYDFNIFKKEIKLISDSVPQKKNNRRFCLFEVAADEFTFPNEG